jgi:hypothetical protein
MFTGLVDSVENLEFSYSERAELGDWRLRKVTIEVIPCGNSADWQFRRKDLRHGMPGRTGR